jgi:ATP-dependent Clp protease protease subunit
MPKQIGKDWVDSYFDRGVDVANRRIFIGKIDQESIANAIKAIYLMETKSDSQHIELIINSEGGEISQAFALYDVMQTVKCPIFTFAIGECMSAALLLVCCGKKNERYCGENCSFMAHDIWSDPPAESATAQIKNAEAMKNLRGRYASILAKHTKKTEKQWLNIFTKSGDTYFDADKAIEFGIVDYVWNEKGQ